jgi:glycosyltransferase involved in cell wall biosynthesis
VKVLLSAYACEPAKGSEPGVGWRWALELADLGLEVFVLTRANNQERIEAELRALGARPNLQFIYYDLPRWALFLKRRTRATLLYYIAWQFGAYHAARRAHLVHSFDAAHHLTFGTIRHFSRLHRLGIPLILGPLGGGESSPFWLRWHTGVRGGIADTIRDAFNVAARYEPVSRAASRAAVSVLAKTAETARALPATGRANVRLALEIGIDPRPFVPGQTTPDERMKRVLYVGRFLYWKGMAIGLRAFARAAAIDPALTLTMIGDGPESRRWRRLADRLGISSKVTWQSWMPQPQLASIYASHGAFLFPSLHDSSGNVVLEALSHGLPVVCLNLGGPAAIVDDTCACVIAVTHGDYDRLLDEMAGAMLRLSANACDWTAASSRAERAAAKHSWASKVAAIELYGRANRFLTCDPEQRAS